MNLDGRWIEPGSEWHLAHAEDRSEYLGPAEDLRHKVMVELIRLAARYDAAPESRMTDVIRRMLSMVTAWPGEECGPLGAIKCRVLLREAEGFLVPANS